jgi:hypothetical protein
MIATVALLVCAPSGVPEQKGTLKGQPKEEAPKEPGFLEKQEAPREKQQ